MAAGGGKVTTAVALSVALVAALIVSAAGALSAPTQSALAQSVPERSEQRDAIDGSVNQAQPDAVGNVVRQVLQTIGDCRVCPVFSRLSEEDRQKYLLLLQAFRSREPSSYPQSDLDDLARIRECVLADHPELFYVYGVQMRTTTSGLFGEVADVSVEGQFSYGSDEAKERALQLDAAATACLAVIPPDADDYAVAKYLYGLLVSHVTYDQVAVAANRVTARDAGWEVGGASGGQGSSAADGARIPQGQTAADALVDGRAVCAGYARAYQHLLQLRGIPCMYVTGLARGQDHAWCAAQLDGEWYFIDPTWGDPQFLGDGGRSDEWAAEGWSGERVSEGWPPDWAAEEWPPDWASEYGQGIGNPGALLGGFDAESEPEAGVPSGLSDVWERENHLADSGPTDYGYLCVTGADIAATHELSCDYPVPECTAIADNYFVREGLLVASGEADAAGALLAEAQSRGDSVARLRFTDRETFEGARGALFDGLELYRFLSGSSYRYSLNEAMLTMTVFLT